MKVKYKKILSYALLAALILSVPAGILICKGFSQPREVPAAQGSAETAKEEAGGTQTDVPGTQTNAPAGSTDKAASGPPASAPGGSTLREQIEQKYTSRLQSLASGYEARLNALVSAAAIEYQAAKKANPNADLSPLTAKYTSAGKALEAECDAQFYAVLAEFEHELRANSFPLDAAVKARETYEARKSERAGQLTPQ